MLNRNRFATFVVAALVSHAIASIVSAQYSLEELNCKQSLCTILQKEGRWNLASPFSTPVRGVCSLSRPTGSGDGECALISRKDGVAHAAVGPVYRTEGTRKRGRGRVSCLTVRPRRDGRKLQR